MLPGWSWSARSNSFCASRVRPPCSSSRLPCVSSESKPPRGASSSGGGPLVAQATVGLCAAGCVAAPPVGGGDRRQEPLRAQQVVARLGLVELVGLLQPDLGVDHLAV